ncbi:MAG: FtsX-like permease family protein, partial [Actinomycetota bacterium]
NELRTRWRAVVSLALIAGIGGGAAIAAIAGARRTQAVYPRFRAATNAFDSLIGVNTDNNTDAEQTAMLAPLQKLSTIRESTLVDAFTGTVRGPNGDEKSFPQIFPIADTNGTFGVTINRLKILQGRRADPTRADEAVLNPTDAHDLGARVGDTLTISFPSVERRVVVVGIAIDAGEIDPTAGGYLPQLVLTPAFYAQNAGPDQRGGPVLAVKFAGSARFRDFQAEVQARADELKREILARAPQLKKQIDQVGVLNLVNASISIDPQNAAIARTAGFQAVGFWVFAGLAALTILSIFAQLLARQAWLEANDHEALRALGMSRSQLFLLSMIRVACVGATATVIALVVAVAASPLFPIGLFRQIEISRGMRADAVVLALGAVGTLVLILLAGVWPAWRANTTAAFPTEAGGVGTNKVANGLAKAGFAPSAVAGVRMALEPGHGKDSVPVRTTIFGTALALAALTASLIFGASINKLVATPSLSGWNYDLVVGTNSKTAGLALMENLKASGTIGSFNSGGIGNALIGGIPADVFMMDPQSFGPSIIAGRRPEAADEIALGPKTLRTLHSSVGKTVVVSLFDTNTNKVIGTPARMRIVGEVVTPQFFFSAIETQVTASVSTEIVKTFPQIGAGTDGSFFVRLARGVSLGKGVTRIRAAAASQNPFILVRSASSDLTNLRRISSIPGLLAGLLGLVAAGTLVHTLVTSVRRRRRDLAILRALGFIRSQVRLTVVWQATSIIVIALAIGLPVGAIAGRWGWHVFIEQFGYVPFAVVPLLTVLLAIPASLLLANLIASLPARDAARTEPAIVLRAE